MQLYQDPIATTCRPVRLFLADHHMDVSTVEMSLFRGDQHAAAFLAVNPNASVPVLVDGDWRLTECSAILKYLAEEAGSPFYPVERRARAAVNAAMDWFNTGFARDFAYRFVYPQVIAVHALPGDANAAQIAAGEAKARGWLAILDRTMLGASPYLAGPQPTIADYLGVAFVTVGDWIGFDLAPWPRIADWVARMRARPGTRAEWAGYDAFTASLRAMADRPAAA